MNKEKYNLLLETYANHCLDSMDMGDMMDYVYQGMLVRFEDMHKDEMLDEIKELAPHLADTVEEAWESFSNDDIDHPEKMSTIETVCEVQS